MHNCYASLERLLCPYHNACVWFDQSSPFGLYLLRSLDITIFQKAQFQIGSKRHAQQSKLPCIYFALTPKLCCMHISHVSQDDEMHFYDLCLRPQETKWLKS